MYTKARIAGHPLHPMLIAFPVALYVATAVSLVVHASTHDIFWFRAALWANVAGVVMAAVAAVPGLIDLLGLPRRSRPRSTAIRHAAFNVLSLALFATSAVMLWRIAGHTFNPANGPYQLDVTAPLALSILGVLSTVAAGWLGWTLVQTHHVGVKDRFTRGRDTDVEPGVDVLDQPRMPAGYVETYRTTIRH